MLQNPDHSETGDTHACVLSPFSFIQLFAIPWTVVRHAPLTMGFPRQEHWTGLQFPPAEDLPDSGIEPMSAAAPALAGGLFTTELPGIAQSGWHVTPNHTD